MRAGVLRTAGLVAIFLCALFPVLSLVSQVPSGVPLSPTATPAAVALRDVSTATPTASATSTRTPTRTATATSTNVPTPTATPAPTDTPIPAPTERAQPPSRGGEPARPAPAPPPPPPPPTATTAPPPQPAASDEQIFSLDLLNQTRAAHGVGPLALDAGISEAARRHAEEMAQFEYLAHVNRQGQQPWDRLRAVGVPFGWAAENLGKAWTGDGSSLPAIQAMHEMMMAETPPDDGHRANILSPKAKRVGIAVARRDGWLYWVCDYAD